MLLTGWPARGILFLLLLFFYISQWGYSSFLSFLQVSFQHLSRLLLQLSCCFVTTTGAALKAAGFFPELLLSSLLPHSEKHGLYCLFFTLPFFFFFFNQVGWKSFFFPSGQGRHQTGPSVLLTGSVAKETAWTPKTYIPLFKRADSWRNDHIAIVF